MDQVRKALTWLKQQHFWVLTVIIALIALFCWYSAAGKLSKEFATNQTAIKSEFQNLDSLQNKPFHPNDDINTQQAEEIKKQAEDVEKVWTKLYSRQSENVLKWPEDLSPAFREYIKTRKFGDDIPRDLRENYRDYIDRHFVTLPKRVSARVIEAGTSGAFEGGYSRGGGRGDFGGEGGAAFMMREEGGGMTASVVGQDDDYLCEWLDQAAVREELNFSTTPSAPRIWVTQENLWAYHTLLDIIANTNAAAGADRRSNAAVRTIVRLEVGQPAALASQGQDRVEVLQPPSSGEVVPGEEGMPMDGGMPMERMPMEGGGGMDGGMYGAERGGFGGVGGMAAGGMTPEQEKAALEAGRYVDANGVPMGGAAAMPVEGGDTSMAAAPVDTSGPFKRLPVRMMLEMDQTWLTHLIAECASQPLQVEVREVRIMSSDMAQSGGGGMGRSFESYRGGFAGSGGGGGSSFQPTSMNAGEISTFKPHPNRVTVVIQGIIYIFNPPDPAILQSEPSEQVVSVQ